MCESLAFMDTWFLVLNVLVTHLPTPRPVPIKQQLLFPEFCDVLGHFQIVRDNLRQWIRVLC